MAQIALGWASDRQGRACQSPEGAHAATARFASVVKHSVMALSAALKWHGDGGDGGVNADKSPAVTVAGDGTNPPLGSFILFTARWKVFTTTSCTSLHGKP